MGVHATAVTASQSMPAGQLSVGTMAICYDCSHTPFQVHSTFRTCFICCNSYDKVSD